MKKNRLVTYGSVIIPPILIYVVLLGAIIIPILFERFISAYTLAILIGLIAGIVPFLVASMHLKLVRDEKISIRAYVIDEIRNNGIRYFAGSLLIQVFIFLWALLFTIPGIIKQYSYAMTPYIMKDDAFIRPIDAITESRRMMDGHKKSLFFLFLTYALPPALLYILVLTIAIVGTAFLPDGAYEGGTAMFISLVALVMFTITVVGPLILAIRNIPRYNVAAALFYEEIRAENHYVFEETQPEWDEEF
ncbi:DUF975 family protein [Marinilactibacillus sp. Marseille-P9653]|uniref:DUF975 family protein n=1 Tax=Marinilactibacillus sp. Marseille-P9653 TaxID=2866583 RepID=UPI001CE434B7|nr:DUF975 family protein [Marinilactibacillus sp. Marseille-P9653]